MRLHNHNIYLIMILLILLNIFFFCLFSIILLESSSKTSSNFVFKLQCGFSLEPVVYVKPFKLVHRAFTVCHPKCRCWVLVFTLILNLYTYLISNYSFSKLAWQDALGNQITYLNVIHNKGPVFSSILFSRDIRKKIKVEFLFSFHFYYLFFLIKAEI